MEKKGCVLIHGFTGGPHEIEFLTKHLEDRGFETRTPILAGHGIELNRSELAKANSQDWIDSVEISVKEMVDKYGEIYLAGFSMGGVIAAYLATRYPVKKLVLIGASVYYIKPRGFFKNIRKNSITKTEIQKYIYKFRKTPVKATLNFRRLVNDLVPYIENVEVPTLIFQGQLDDLVEPRSANYIYDTIKSGEKYIHFLPNSKHLIWDDSDREMVIELVDDFFN